MKNNKFELLAPAGDFERLKTAIYFGADAVYFAGKNYGLRAYSSNFDTMSIKDTMDYIHAHGKKGYVTGMHGGIEHVMIYFDEETLEDLAIDDKILVRAYGQGLQIEGHEDVAVMSIDPNLFEKLGVTSENGKLQVPVVAKVPAYLMGSGTGSSNAYSGDYDIMTADKDEITRLGLDKLRFGDLVLLEDHDNTYGTGYLGGAISIGVIIHSDCVKSGHGPGVTVIMSSSKGNIEGVINQNANIGYYMNK